MPKKTVADVDVKGKRGADARRFQTCHWRLEDQPTIAASPRRLPTIRNVIDRGGRLILDVSPRRPKGGPEAKFSLKPAADRLSELLAKAG